MARPYKDLIREKKIVFQGFCIPWDVEIERRLEAEAKAKPDVDPQYILDRIARPYIDRKLAK